MRCALSHFIAHCPPHFRHAVTYSAQAWAAKALFEIFTRSPHVAVAAGLGQRLAAKQYARAGYESLLHRGGDAPVGTAGVADSCEAAKKHAFQHFNHAARSIKR